MLNPLLITPDPANRSIVATHLAATFELKANDIRIGKFRSQQWKQRQQWK